MLWNKARHSFESVGVDALVMWAVILVVAIVVVAILLGDDK